MPFHFNTAKLTFFFLTGFLFFIPQSCEKSLDNPVPGTYVNVNINLNNFVLGVNESMILTNVMTGAQNLGYDNNGIIIFRNDLNEFSAYDRTCPYDIDRGKSIAVNIDQSKSQFAVCPECQSVYQLFYSGFPSEGSVSPYPLKMYHTSFNTNTQNLHIFN